MDLASLLSAHYVLSLGSIREAARVLSRPVSSVAAGLSRLQVHIATPLTTPVANRIQPTLEGLRVGHDLKHAADLILDLAGLSLRSAEMPIEQHAARLAVPMLALQRFSRRRPQRQYSSRSIGDRHRPAAAHAPAQKP